MEVNKQHMIQYWHWYWYIIAIFVLHARQDEHCIYENREKLSKTFDLLTSVTVTSFL